MGSCPDYMATPIWAIMETPERGLCWGVFLGDYYRGYYGGY